MDFDDSQSIGKRYRRQDEIGTPYCVTVDFDTLEDNAVTIRERRREARARANGASVRPRRERLLEVC